MAGEWQNTIISQVVDIISGGTPKTGVAEYWNGDIPWLSVADFNTGYRWVSNSEKTITQKGLEESATTLLKTRDIIISARGTVGVVAQLAKPMAFNQSCYGIRGLGGVTDNDFIFYVLKEAVKEMRQIAHGAVFDTIIRSTFDSIQINLPSLNEQRAIAHILGTLDDKIELNRKMNQTLEAMAQAIFRSWFVDFDPVRAKAEGRQPNGLDPEIAKLFPDSFQDSEIGEIPRGWKIFSMPEIIEINPARLLKKGEVAPYLDMANLPTKSARADDVVIRPFGSGTKFMNGDTLLARITPCLENGKTVYVDFLENEQVGWGSTEFIVLRSKPPLPIEFTYFLARDPDFRAFAITNMTGTSGRQRVPADCFRSFLIVAPLTKIADRFGEYASAIMRQMKANDEQSRTLAAIRDTLLPKLLSGEIRVKDAEKFVEKRQ